MTDPKKGLPADELAALRAEIDCVDRDMAALFERRMRAVAAIADYKRANGLPILDAAREEAVIRKNVGLIGDAELRPYYAKLLCDLMRTSRSYQGALCADATEDKAALLPVRLADAEYVIRVERGALARVGELIPLDRRVLIVTDEGVPEAYAAAVAAAAKAPTTVTVPQGEGSKSLAMLERLLSAMLDAGFTRTDAVVAVGGGVCGDLAGLAAATYMRGIDFYNIPTTLLAQVDSSIGGKTAVNLAGVKNSVGVFHQPRAVLIDPDVLSTLPPRQISSGLAEVIKMAATSDRDLFERMEREGFSPIEDIIVGALRIKRSVVEQDEREGGLRRVLNFGHTLGHGYESAAALSGLTHGECVGLGMLRMAAPEPRERIRALLTRAGLPTVTDLPFEEVTAPMAHDKKADGDKIRYIYVERIGEFSERCEPIGALIARLREEW